MFANRYWTWKERKLNCVSFSDKKMNITYWGSRRVGAHETVLIWIEQVTHVTYFHLLVKIKTHQCVANAPDLLFAQLATHHSSCECYRAYNSNQKYPAFLAIDFQTREPLQICAHWEWFLWHQHFPSGPCHWRINQGATRLVFTSLSRSNEAQSICRRQASFRPPRLNSTHLLSDVCT